MSYAATRPLTSMGLRSLDKYGRDLTQEARKGLLDPVYGRDELIDRLLQVGCCP